MEVSYNKTLLDELKDAPLHIVNETLNYLRFLKENKKNEIIGYSNGKPVTIDGYKEHIDASRNEFNNGDFTPVEDL